MIKITTAKQIATFLSRELKISGVKDSSKNGLQVDCAGEVSRIAYGVDASLELFERAKRLKCQMVIVHHGLLWKGKDKRLEITKKRIHFLKKNKISLYGCHLPLDRHRVYGNNIIICDILGVKGRKLFGDYHGVKIGYSGELNMDIKDLVDLVGRKVGKVGAHLFGRKKVKKVAIISGGGPWGLREGVGQGVDTFIFGERSHMEYHTEKELGINVLYAGHYNTEVFGVKALKGLIERKFNIKGVFIDIPTGM